MNKITIIIPVENYEILEEYYRDVLSFPLHEGLFFLPVETSDVALRLIIIDEEAKSGFPRRSDSQFSATGLKRIFYLIAIKFTKMAP